MKLYVFQSQSYGQDSFFVMAESEADARAAVTKWHVDNDRQPIGLDDGWFELIVAEAGQVIDHPNS